MLFTALTWGGISSGFTHSFKLSPYLKTAQSLKGSWSRTRVVISCFRVVSLFLFCQSSAHPETSLKTLLMFFQLSQNKISFHLIHASAAQPTHMGKKAHDVLCYFLVSIIISVGFAWPWNSVAQGVLSLRLEGRSEGSVVFWTHDFGLQFLCLFYIF